MNMLDMNVPYDVTMTSMKVLYKPDAKRKAKSATQSKTKKRTNEVDLLSHYCLTTSNEKAIDIVAQD